MRALQTRNIRDPGSRIQDQEHVWILRSPLPAPRLRGDRLRGDRLREDGGGRMGSYEELLNMNELFFEKIKGAGPLNFILIHNAGGSHQFFIHQIDTLKK